MVRCPKYRKKIFECEDLQERAGQLVEEISEEYGFGIIEMEVSIDHIHILTSFPPKFSIGEAVRIIKSKSARGMFREVAWLRKRLWSGELWEDGHFTRTLGDHMTRDVMRKDIEHRRDLMQGPAQIEIKMS